MLYGKILHSRYPHAKILSIDTSRAEALEGVYAVITAKDTPKIKFGFMKDNLPLKDEIVRSVRDEIAAVAAVDEETAARAVDLIQVEYEKLPAYFDPLGAMAPAPSSFTKVPRVMSPKSPSVSKLETRKRFSNGKMALRLKIRSKSTL